MANDDNDVGYGRPPVATQFKKGQSGNPRGRPRKSVSRRAITERVLGETQRLPGQPRGRRVLYTTLEVVVLKLKQLAASGHAQATALTTRIAERFGRQEAAFEEVGTLVVPEVRERGGVDRALFAEGRPARRGGGGGVIPTLQRSVNLQGTPTD